MNKSFIIAEAGVNHNGSIEIGKKLIDLAFDAGADAIKFQTFKAQNLASLDAETAEYQRQMSGKDNQYEMLKKLEMSEEFHYQLIEHSISVGIEFMSSPFDLESAKFLINLGMQKIKIPSGEVNNLPFIEELAKYNLPIILSTGMCFLDEVRDAVDTILRNQKISSDNSNEIPPLTLLHCTSNYPTNFNDVNLNAIRTMQNEFNLPVGYSDHTIGNVATLGAIAMGASIIEKHITVDKKMIGPDHKASMPYNEFKVFVDNIRSLEISLGDGIKRPCQSEIPIRKLVRKSANLTSDKHIGDEINKDDLVFIRPNIGVPPNHLIEILGKKLKNNKTKGSFLTWDDIDE